MFCTMLDYGIKRARVYNQGVEIPSITDHAAGPFTVIPFENFVLYMPFDGDLREKDNIYYLYDDAGEKAVVFSAASATALVDYDTPLKKGDPFMICGSYGNSKRGGIGQLGTVYSYQGAGFTLAIYGNHLADIFPSGTTGGVVNITGTAIASSKQTLICYHRLTASTTSDRNIFAYVRERGSDMLPDGPNITKYLVFDKWSSSQLKTKTVQDTDASFQFIFGTYTAGSAYYSKKPVQEDIAIHYTKYGNPSIPKTAPQSVSVWVAKDDSVPAFIRRENLMTFAPYFPEFDLKWYTNQDLYTVGWVCNNSVYTGSVWDMEGPEDFGFNFVPYTFRNFSGDISKNALFVSPETLYIEDTDASTDIAHILLLDKLHGVDIVKQYKIEENLVGGLYVYINENPVSTVLVWHGIVSSIARFRKESDSESEKHPPAVFNDIDTASGLQWGLFGILEWTPNALNTDPAGVEGDIIPILFFLSRTGHLPLRL